MSIKAQERKLRGDSDKLLIRSGKVKLPVMEIIKDVYFRLLKIHGRIIKNWLVTGLLYFVRGMECVKITRVPPVKIHWKQLARKLIRKLAT